VCDGMFHSQPFVFAAFGEQRTRGLLGNSLGNRERRRIHDKSIRGSVAEKRHTGGPRARRGGRRTTRPWHRPSNQLNLTENSTSFSTGRAQKRSSPKVSLYVRTHRLRSPIVLVRFRIDRFPPPPVSFSPTRRRPETNTNARSCLKGNFVSPAERRRMVMNPRAFRRGGFFLFVSIC